MPGEGVKTMIDMGDEGVERRPVDHQRNVSVGKSVGESQPGTAVGQTLFWYLIRCTREQAPCYVLSGESNIDHRRGVSVQCNSIESSERSTTAFAMSNRCTTEKARSRLRRALLRVGVLELYIPN